MERGNPSVAVVGGGIAGMTAAYDLARAGLRVRLYEAAPELGGQVRTFPVGGTRLEAFYHHLFRSDREILALMAELGIADRLRWLPSKAGFLWQGRIYPFTTAFDLLRYRPLPLHDRLRLGLVTFYLQRKRDWREFESISADRWLRRAIGPRAYERVWKPLLVGKFGDLYREVSMVWFWGKVYLRGTSRRSVLERELLGYPEGSFQILLDALEARLRELGVEIWTGTPVERVAVEGGRATGVWAAGQVHRHDAVLLTVPNFHVLRLVPELPEDWRRRLSAVRYQGAVCLVLALDRPLSDIYWLNIADADMPFLGAIEHTNYVPPEVYGGLHLLYLTNYLAPDHPYFEMDGQALLQAYLPGLRRIQPAFEPGWVRDLWLFRERAAQPVIPVRYSRILLPHRTPIPGLWLANTTQIYPEDRGTNYSVRLGRRVAAQVLETLDPVPSRSEAD